MAGRSKNPGRREDESGRNGMPGNGAHRTQRRKRQRGRTYERDCESSLNTSMDSEASASSSTGFTREEVTHDIRPRYVANDRPIQVGANGGRREGAEGLRVSNVFDSTRRLSNKDLGILAGGNFNNPAGGRRWSGGSQSFSPPDEETLTTFQNQLFEVTHGMERMKTSENDVSEYSSDNGLEQEDRARSLIYSLRGAYAFPKELLHSQMAGDLVREVDEARRRL